MTTTTIRWLIDELEKCDNKDRPVKIMDIGQGAMKDEDRLTVHSISGRYEPDQPLRIYTWL